MEPTLKGPIPTFWLMLLSSIALGGIGALLGILAVGQLESLPTSDNESMTLQIHHLFKQAVGLIIGGLVGGVVGGVGAFVFASARQRKI